LHDARRGNQRDGLSVAMMEHGALGSLADEVTRLSVWEIHERLKTHCLSSIP
jgi:hypothetical protein